MPSQEKARAPSQSEQEDQELEAGAALVVDLTQSPLSQQTGIILSNRSTATGLTDASLAQLGWHPVNRFMVHSGPTRM